jgi:hypothetical protein
MKLDQPTAIKLLAYLSAVTGEAAAGLAHQVTWGEVAHHVTYLSIGLMGALGMAASGGKLASILATVFGAPSSPAAVVPPQKEEQAK